MAQVAGYQAGFSVDEGVGDARPWDAWAMKRMTINNTETLDQLQKPVTERSTPVTDIRPAPGMRVVGIDTTVSVDITAVSRESDGPAPHRRAVHGADDHRRDWRSTLRAGRHPRRQTRLPRRLDEGDRPAGRAYYASWGIETGDKPH